MLSKELVWFSAIVCSWLLWLLPVAVVMGHTGLAAKGLAVGLVAGLLLLIAYRQAQQERRRDPLARHAYVRARRLSYD